MDDIESDLLARLYGNEQDRNEAHERHVGMTFPPPLPLTPLFLRGERLTFASGPGGGGTRTAFHGA